MGKRHARAAALQNTTEAQEELRQAESGYQTAEQTRSLLESYLGQEEQVAGTGQYGSYDRPELNPYTQRYQLDQQYAQETISNVGRLRANRDPFTSGYDQFRGGIGALDYWRKFETEANELMQQAENAARAGNMEEADALKKQAQEMIGGLTAQAQRGYNLTTDARTAALQKAGSAQGRIVGGLLKTARGFMDPESSESQGFRRSLTEGAERSIAAESRQAQRQIRDLGMVRGAGRSATAQQAIAARSAEEFAAQRAQVHTEANQFFQTFRLGFAKDAVQTAQDWVNNASGVRDAYNDRVANMKGALSENSMKLADQFWAKYGADVAHERARKAGTFGKVMGGIGMAAAIIGAPFTGGASLMAIPGIVQGSQGQQE